MGLVQGGLTVLSKAMVSRRSFSAILAVLCTMTAVVGLSVAQAQAALTRPYTGVSFGPGGPGVGSFGTVQGVAIDQTTGDVYVLDTGASEGSLLKFDAAGNPLRFTGVAGEPYAITGLKGAENAEDELAVDSSSGPAKGDVYVAVGTSNGEAIDVFASDGASLGSLTEATAPWGETCGVAVDASGNVYVATYGGFIDKFVPTANPVTNSDYQSSLVGGNPCNIAVDSVGDVFADTWNAGPVTRYEASQFGLPIASGSILDMAGSSLAADPSDDHVLVDERDRVREYGARGEPFEEPLAVFGATGSGSISESFGIAVDQTSGDVYVSNGQGKLIVFGTPVVVPDVSAQSVTGLTATGVTLNGTVNPDGQQVTSCQFEYGTTAGALTSIAPCIPSPGSGSAPVTVAASLAGLASGTTYHYKLVAANANGASESPEASVQILGPAVSGGSFSEVGSSSATVSANVNPNGEATTFRVEYGPTTAYGSSSASGNVGSGSEASGVVAHLSGLNPGTVYHFRVVATSAAGTAYGPDVTFSTLPASLSSLPDGRGYEMVTPVENEGDQVFIPEGAYPETAEVIESVRPYRAAADGSAVAYVGEPTAEGNGSEQRRAGNEFLATRGPAGWTQRDIQPRGLQSPLFTSFSSDLSTAVLASKEPLSGAIPSGYEYLYTRSTSTGTLAPLFTATPPNRTRREFGGAPWVESYETSIYRYYAGASDDSKRQFFEANDALTPEAIDGGPSENNLYESDGGSLRSVNVLPGGTGSPNASFGAPPATFVEAENTDHAISADGSRVFWTDMSTGSLYVRENGTSTSLISEGATFWTASADGSHVLYAKGGDLYEDELSSGVATDLTPNGHVLGLSGSSENAEYVYFVAEGDLAPGAAKGQPNLYLYHDHTVSFIATLAFNSPEDEASDELSDWRPSLGHRVAEASADGHGFVFMSVKSLTGYDNRNASGKLDTEVYQYDADSGVVSCVSCSPSGERPTGRGGWLVGTGEANTYQIRSITEDGGRVFFQSAMPLVAQDTNGKQDVYEWERYGVGSCQLSDGCVYMLSDGSSPMASYLVDASADGSNVFIITEAQLVAKDQNNVYDLYDVRVGAEPEPLPLQCNGTGCQGVPEAPPIFSTPASVTFSGVGNFPVAANPVVTKAKPKAKHKRKKRKARRKPRRLGAKKARNRVPTRRNVTGKSRRGAR